MDKENGEPSDGASGTDPLLRIDNHDELESQLPEISRRINSQPELGRLLLINPLLVLEDVGVLLSEELGEHVRRTIGFPKGRIRRIHEVRDRLRQLLKPQGLQIPKDPTTRADLLFDHLGLEHHCEERPRTLSIDELRPYRSQSEIADALYELGRLERGAIVFHSRGSYQAHKEGRVHHPWIKSIHLRESS